MKKILGVLAVFLLAVLACPAAADEPLCISPVPDDIRTEVLVEPVPYDVVVKWVLLGKYGEDKLGLLSSIVQNLKLKKEPMGSPYVWYSYTVYFSAGEHGNGYMYDSYVLSVEKNPGWTVPVCRFSADEGYVFAGWEIYGNMYQRWETVILTEYETVATALWQME